MFHSFGAELAAQATKFISKINKFHF